MEAKPRILYLLKILLERTDEEHPLSTTQLIGILNEEYGISAHRTTITKDIAALVEYGLDIVTIHSTQSKYFVASRKFELPELKLLIDAVESSKFITKKKSETLIEKIHTGAKAPRTLRPLPLLRFAVSATGGAHLCSIQYYLRFWLSICCTSLAVSALRIMRYCLNTPQLLLKGNHLL